MEWYRGVIMSAEAAKAAIATQDIPRAESILRAALKENPNDDQVLRLLADIIAGRGELQEAKAIIEPLAAASPTPELLEFLSSLQYELHELDDCEATLEQLIQTSPAK